MLSSMLLWQLPLMALLGVELVAAKDGPLPILAVQLQPPKNELPEAADHLCKICCESAAILAAARSVATFISASL